MAIWGADIAQLKTLGTKLQAGSSEIDKQKSLLTKVLEGTDWKGPDADKFRSEWNGQHDPTNSWRRHHYRVESLPRKIYEVRYGRSSQGRDLQNEVLSERRRENLPRIASSDRTVYRRPLRLHHAHRQHAVDAKCFR